jgi:hypothetical protein
MKHSLKSLTKLAVSIALTCLVFGLPTAVRAQSSERTSVWVSTAWGSSYKVEDILRSNPHLKRLFVPLFQLAPALSSRPFSVPEEYLAREAAEYPGLHARGVEVIGVLSPLKLDDSAMAAVRPEWCERQLTLAFDGPPTTPWLSIYSPGANEMWEKNLAQCLQKAKLDGVYLNLAYPTSMLFGYSTHTRQTFVDKHGFDPVDVDFPLGLPFNLKLKDQELVDDIVKDRLDQVHTCIRKLIAICNDNKKPVGILAPLNIYDYAATTRAASGGDWANILIENPGVTAMLSQIDGDPLSVDSLKSLSLLTARLKIDPRRLSILTTEQPQDIRALSDFKKTQSESSPSLSITFLLRKQ